MKTNIELKFTFFVSVLFLANFSFAQEILSVKQAVEIALENNYDIKLAENNINIANENLTYGNAGFLPTVTANLNRNNNLQNSKQTQASGEVRSLKNAKNNSLNYGVSLGWTVFDGMGMFRRYDILKETKFRNEVELKRNVLTKVSDVITTYYTIVEQNNLLEAIESNLKISRERVRTSENRFEIGKASRLEVLNAQVNLNEDESQKIRINNQIRNLKIVLNSLMVRDLSLDFEINNEVNLVEDLSLENLLNDAKNHNPDLQITAINKNIAELELLRVKANRYPTVRLNAGYNFAESESSLGFTTSSSSRGLNYGIAIAVNVFDGFNQKRNEQIAKLQINNSTLMMEQQNLLIQTSITTLYQTYSMNLALAKIEADNVAIAKRNLEITMDKFKIGTISAVEFRDAQENYINTISRLNAANLQTKLSELNLREITGKIDLES